MDNKSITKEFTGQRRFLSNFYSSPIRYNDKMYDTVEHFYQAHKAKSIDDHETIRTKCLSPADAKKFGKLVVKRNHWDSVKVFWMKLGLILKFTQHSNLAKQLIDTGTDLLQENNNWKDTFWGVDLKSGEGHNMLGILLMDIRSILIGVKQS